jgi:hypothetical protein
MELILVTSFVILYFICVKKDEFVAISHMPAYILNQTVHSNAICTVGTDPTEPISPISQFHGFLLENL